MKTDIIEEIWNIRGLVDCAIFNHDINAYNQAVAKFKELFDSEAHQRTLTSASLGAVYESVEYLKQDREANFAMIAFNLYKLKKLVLEPDCEEDEEETQFSSVLEILWYTRDMFDYFKFNSSEMDENLIELYESTKANLKQLIEYCETLVGERSKMECETLRNIYKEVEQYGKDLKIGL